MEYELAFLKALTMTIFIECLAAAVLKKLLGRRLSISFIPYVKLLSFVALASALTLPYAWFVLPVFVKHGITYILIAEVSVTLIEAFLYRFTLNLSIFAALILSISLNFISYFIGNIL